MSRERDPRRERQARRATYDTNEWMDGDGDRLGRWARSVSSELISAVTKVTIHEYRLQYTTQNFMYHVRRESRAVVGDSLRVGRSIASNLVRAPV